MKTLRLTIATLFAALAAVVAARAQQATSGATLIAVEGTAMVTMPGGAAVPAKAGMALPEGASVTTAAGSKALIQTHPGIVAGLAASTTATVEQANTEASGMRNARIGVTNGTVVSQLDPSKSKSNNYSVRTPRGVAAARGTIFTTTVTVGTGANANTYTVTINTLAGTVSTSFVNSAGVTTTIEVKEGGSTTKVGDSPPTSGTLGNALTGPGAAAVAEALQAAVAVTAIVAQATTSAIGSNLAGDAGDASRALTNVLTQVTKAAADSGNIALIQSTGSIATQYAGTTQLSNIQTSMSDGIRQSSASLGAKTGMEGLASQGQSDGLGVIKSVTVNAPLNSTGTTTINATRTTGGNTTSQIDPGTIIVSPNN